MGYTHINEFGVKDTGDDYLTIKIDDDEGLYDDESICSFSKDEIDRIIKTLQEERQRKWGKA